MVGVGGRVCLSFGYDRPRCLRPYLCLFLLLLPRCVDEPDARAEHQARQAGLAGDVDGHADGQERGEGDEVEVVVLCVGVCLNGMGA